MVVVLPELHAAHASHTLLLPTPLVVVFVSPLVLILIVPPKLLLTLSLVLVPVTLPLALPVVPRLAVRTLLPGGVPVHRRVLRVAPTPAPVVLILLLVIPNLVALAIAHIYICLEERLWLLVLLQEESLQVVDLHRSEKGFLYIILW